MVLVSERLRQIGFLGGHNLLQAESFGSPQRRGRVWLIYFRAGCGSPRRQWCPITEALPRVSLAEPLRLPYRFQSICLGDLGIVGDARRCSSGVP